MSSSKFWQSKFPFTRSLWWLSQAWVMCAFPDAGSSTKDDILNTSAANSESGIRPSTCEQHHYGRADVKSSRGLSSVCKPSVLIVHFKTTPCDSIVEITKHHDHGALASCVVMKTRRIRQHGSPCGVCIIWGTFEKFSYLRWDGNHDTLCDRTLE